jgi:uncharacterized protein (DUF2344 family)
MTLNDTYYISIIYNYEHSTKQMNEKKKKKHSNEELLNQKFHRINGNIFGFQPKI